MNQINQLLERVTLRTLLLSLVLGVQPGMAATFIISNGDVAGLIAAINAANANPDADTINLATGGTYNLTAVDNTERYYGPNGLPVINSPITINGNGATIQRSSAAGTPEFRIFIISNGLSQLTLNGLTIAGGKGSGGGLLNTGITLVINSTVTGNGGGDGGGIQNRGNLTVQNSTISYNTNFGGYGGGGILNFGTTTIIHSTLFENRADAPPGFQGRGDAISDPFGGQGSTTLKNSIVASPTQGLGLACYTSGAPTSFGHNIVGDVSCGLTGTGDLNSTNPLLGPLANNGGPTQTDAPLSGSPAIDAVPIANCTDTAGNPIATDQRGITRPQGSACDIGSVELVVAPELFWGMPVTPQLSSNVHPNIVWFDLDGIPGPTPVPATPAIPLPYGAWTSEGGVWWMDAVQAPGQPEVLLVLTSGYHGELRAFRADGTNLTPCGSYPLPVPNNSENGGVRVAQSGAFALVSIGNHPYGGGLGSNRLLKFPLNLTATGPCLLPGDPTQIPISSNTTIRNIDFNSQNSQQAVISGYSNVVTFVNPISGATLCDVPLINGSQSLSRLEARYRPDGTEVWAVSYDGRQIAIIAPPGAAGACTVTKFITAGFGPNDNLFGGVFHPDPHVPVYYVSSYPGDNLFALDTNAKSISGGTSIHGAFGTMAVTRGPAYRLEVPIYGCCPQFGYTNTYDVSTLSKAANPELNLIGAHASSVNMRTVATLRTVGQPDLTIAKTHTGNFTQGQTIANFLITVTNSGVSPTVGTVTVTDDLSGAPGLTVVNFAGFTGTNWVCSGTTCTRSDPLAAGASYDPIELTVSVAANASSPQVNHASVSGGGEVKTANNTATDSVIINQLPDLTIAKAHVGTGFRQTQQGAQYTLTVRNSGSVSTTGSLTVTDTLPGGLTFASGSGGGFSCSASGQFVTCANGATPIAAGEMATITLNVNVSATAAASLTNSATVACACTESNTANNASNVDTVSVVQLPDLTISKTHLGDHFSQGQQNAAYRISVANVGTGAEVGAFTVTDLLPSGLTFAGFDGAGNGFSCSASGQLVTCANSGPIAPFIAPNFVLYVNVSATAAASLTNSATVLCTCTETNTVNNTSNIDTVSINPVANISGKVSVTQGGFARNRATGLWVATLTVSNSSAASVSGPIQVVLTNLSSNATMVNNTGMRNGSPYITVSTGTLAPGASVSVPIQFTNPSNGFITFTAVTASGVF